MKIARVLIGSLVCIAAMLLCSCSDSDALPDIEDWVLVGTIDFDELGPVCAELDKEGIDYAMDPTSGRPSISVPPEEVETAKEILARHAGGP